MTASLQTPLPSATTGPARVVALAHFAPPLGLAALGAAWAQARELLGAPAWPAEVLFWLAAGLWLGCLTAYLVHSARHSGSLQRDLRDPATGHLVAYLPVIGLLLAAHSGEWAPAAARIAVVVLVVALALLAARSLASWFTGGLAIEDVHPGLLLPVVAGAFVASIALASVGLAPAAVAAFGAGLFFWLVVGSLVVVRLVVGPRLPAGRAPLLSVLVAPPATGGTACMAAGLDVAHAADAFAGILAILLTVQVVLLPVYRRLRFGPAFWAFMFPLASTTNFLLHWLPTRAGPGWLPFGWLLLSIATVSILGILARSAHATASAVLPALLPSLRLRPASTREKPMTRSVLHPDPQDVFPEEDMTAVIAPRFATLGEIHRAALDRLPPEVADYLEGGAGQEVSLRRNRESFERWGFAPRAMSGAQPAQTSTTFMGIPLSLPVLTAPFGGDGLFHDEGQLAVRRANRRFGTASIVPEAGSHSLEANAESAPGTGAIGQLHPMGTEANFVDVVARYERAGYQALCVTVDCPTAGWRERNKVNRWSPPVEVLAGNYPSTSDALTAAFGQLFTHDEAVWTWEHLGSLLRGTTLPWMAKGILTVEDARAAVAAGASALLVSNHGGRQLDSVPAPIDVLPAIRAAVGDGVEIALDSGIRTGTDVLKALSLGADAVVIGRLAIYGVCADGEDGVVRTLELLANEIKQALPLIGCTSVRDLGRDNILDLHEVR